MRARRTTRTVALAVASVVAVVALGGCTSADDPPETPTPTPTSASPTLTVSPSPSATETSTIPAAAREKTEAGAKAFVGFFFDSVNIAWTTPLPGAVARLSDPTCSFCKQVEDTSSDLKSKSYRYRDRAVSVSGLRTRGGAPEGQAFIEVVLRQHPASIVDATGKVVSTDEEGSGDSLVGLKWTDDGWRILEVEVA